MGGRVVVKQHPKVEEKTKGGIIIAQTVDKPLVWGTVVMAAKECTVEEGWEVMFVDGSAAPLVINEEELLLMPEDSILLARH